jgi:hypothetical protein
VWSTPAFDDALGLVYLPTGNATPDFWGGRRTEMSLDAVKASIPDRGDRVMHYSYAPPRAQSDAMIGPCLVAQAKARIAERKSKHLRILQSAGVEGISDARE